MGCVFLFSWLVSFGFAGCSRGWGWVTVVCWWEFLWTVQRVWGRFLEVGFVGLVGWVDLVCLADWVGLAGLRGTTGQSWRKER